MKILDKIKKDIQNLFKIQDKKTFLKQNAPYLVFFYFGNIFSKHITRYIGGDIFDKIYQAILDINEMSFYPSFDIINMINGVIFAIIIKLLIYTKSKNEKKFRQGAEYGSARWSA